MHAFDRGKSPFNYVTGMPHDGWRVFLPWLIDSWKAGRTSTISREGVTIWYRLTRASACSSGGTIGNTASQRKFGSSFWCVLRSNLHVSVQNTYPPGALAQDKIFFTALLQKNATVSVTIGGVAVPATFLHTPDGGIGLHHGSVDFGSNTGAVVVTVIRSGTPVVSVTGKAITSNCPAGIQNWNAWVGASLGGVLSTVQAAAPEGCREGTGK